jgi:SAM-dependent methyltransferase
MIRLDIGCGDVCEPGWTGVDPYYEGAQVSADAWDLPYDDATVDAIRCSHALEHIHKDVQPAVWEEWARVLRPGGTVWVSVPDSLYVLQHLLEVGPSDPWGRILVWGHVRWKGDEHVTAFAPDTLLADAEAAGFAVHSCSREWTGRQNQRSIVLEAHRP